MSRRSALIFDAHLGVIGGAQRVTGLLASAIAPEADIVIASPEKFDPARFGELYGVDVPACETRGVGNDVPEISALTREFDIFISNQVPWMPPQAKVNLMYVHFPLHRARRRIAGIPTPFRDPAYFADRYDRIMVNSTFTQTWVRKRWNLDSDVVYVYPSLAGGSWDPKMKKRMILSVSRFQPAKAQGHVLDAFTMLRPEGWELVLAGHAYETAYVDELRRRSKGHNVRFVLEPSAEDLAQLYREAWIFWHLRGMDETNVPDDLEHFGLVVAEAMSHGAVPVAFDGGGHPEIITRESGFLVSNVRELGQVTRILIESDDVRRATAEEACRRSTYFTKQRFDEGVRSVLASVDAAI